MTTPVVGKYMACTQFDPATEECAAMVWVDPPTMIPPLSATEGAQLGTFCAVAIFAAAILGPVTRKGASLRS